MSEHTQLTRFIEAARRVGSEVHSFSDLAEAVQYIANKAGGITLVPETALSRKYDLAGQLQQAAVPVHIGNYRLAGHFPAAGVTFSNFAMADTGTVVLESTDETLRLTTTLPERHFVLVDPRTILSDNLAAAAPMARLHQGSRPVFVAYITGPSRTADIERVLTIGCHGPRELHILVVEGISDDLMEN